MLISCSTTNFSEKDCLFIKNTDSQRVSWGKKLPVELHIHESISTSSDGLGKVAAMRRAVATWNALIPSEERPLFEIISVGISGDVTSLKNLNVIYLRDRWISNNYSAQQQGVTKVLWRGKQIISASIFLNSENFSFSTTENVAEGKVDFESLVLHELGHILGLKHHEDSDTVMYFSLALGEKRRSFNAQIERKCSEKPSDKTEQEEECSPLVSEREVMEEFLGCEY